MINKRMQPKTQKQIKQLKTEKIPLTLFTYRGVGGMEALVWYLCDHREYSISAVAHFLNRDARTIHTIRKRASVKFAEVTKKNDEDFRTQIVDAYESGFFDHDKPTKAIIKKFYKLK